MPGHADSSRCAPQRYIEAAGSGTALMRRSIACPCCPAPAALPQDVCHPAAGPARRAAARDRPSGWQPGVPRPAGHLRRLNTLLRPQLEAAWQRPAAGAVVHHALALLQPSRFAGLRSVALHSDRTLTCDLERLQVPGQGSGAGGIDGGSV